MVEVRQSTIVDAPIDAVWHILRDFNSHAAWHPAIAWSEIEGGEPVDAVGSVRRFTLADGSQLREQLLSHSDRDFRLSYCLLEAPLPLMNYVATLQLKTVTDGDRTFWEWRSKFDPPSLRRDELVRLVSEGIYQAGFGAIKRRFGARGRADPASTQAGRSPMPPPPGSGGERRPTPTSNPSPQGEGESRSDRNWTPGGSVVEEIKPRQQEFPSLLVRKGGASSDAPPLPPAREGQERTRAILVERYGGPEELRLREVALPHPGHGEVQLRHTVIGVNFIDVYCRTGFFDLLKPPGVPGMEAAGVVEAVGFDVAGLAVGDRVAYACPPVGSYSARRTMSADLLVKLSSDMPDEIAAAGLLKGVTASFLLHEVHVVKPGSTVLIHAAAGGIGQLLVQWAKRLGATVIATVSTEAKADIVDRLGANHVIVSSREDFSSAVLRLTGGRGADVAYDAVGADSFAGSIAALAIRGHLVSFGQASGPIGTRDIGGLTSKSITLSRPNYGHYTDTPEKLAPHVHRFFAAIRQGLLTVSQPTRYDLARAADAHRDLEARATTGSLVLIP